MGLETPTYISDLNVANPTSTDGVKEGDDHIRNLKTAIKNTFPNINGAVSVTEEELNYVQASDVTISAGTADIGAANGLYVEVTGTGPITSFGSPTGSAKLRFVRFLSKVSLTHASTLVCPGAKDLQVYPDDQAILYRDGVTGWIVLNYFPASASQPIAFKVNRNGTVLALTANTITNVACSNEVFDIGGYYNNSTYKFIPPEGYYLISLNVAPSGTGTDNNTIVGYIYKNGVSEAQALSRFTPSNQSANCSVVVYCDGNDEIEAYASTQDGTDLSGDVLYTNFSGFRIG